MEPGRRLGAYEIIAPLGAGGMGEVWRARDTRLGRDVAFKVLPAETASNPDRRERFQREAKTLAHRPSQHRHRPLRRGGRGHLLPHDGAGRGPDPRPVHPGGRLSLDRLLDFALPLSEAVAAAHDRGVVHRDLKPGNVMVGTDGRLKVLDFGLAKRGATRGSADEISTRTREGTIVLCSGASRRSSCWMAFGRIRGSTI